MNKESEKKIRCFVQNYKRNEAKITLCYEYDVGKFR